MTVVQADGQNVRPVETDEFQIAVAETYDVIVTPSRAAYTIVGEALDRSGMARGTLAVREGLVAPVPTPRQRPGATMKDLGLDMGTPEPTPARPVDPAPPPNPPAAHTTGPPDTIPRPTR